jgi:hypothetical protein
MAQVEAYGDSMRQKALQRPTCKKRGETTEKPSGHMNTCTVYILNPNSPILIKDERRSSTRKPDVEAIYCRSWPPSPSFANNFLQKQSNQRPISNGIVKPKENLPVGKIKYSHLVRGQERDCAPSLVTHIPLSSLSLYLFRLWPFTSEPANLGIAGNYWRAEMVDSSSGAYFHDRSKRDPRTKGS